MCDRITGSESVTRQDQLRLYNLLKNLCIARGITMPKLKIMEDDALNGLEWRIARLRKKLTGSRVDIVTGRGVGYQAGVEETA